MVKKIKAELELRRKSYENTHEYRLEYEMENLLEWIAYEEEKVFKVVETSSMRKETALKMFEELADVAAKTYKQQFPQ